jgi:23S rRNA (guanosine2251-2'-O)-methyltransferase
LPPKPPFRAVRKPAPDPSAERNRARPVGAARQRPDRARGEGWLYGRHAVVAALANPARRWRRLVVLADQRDEAAAIAAAARAAHIGDTVIVEVHDRGTLNLLLPEGAVHQGWALQAEPLEAVDLAEVLRAAEARPSKRSVVVVLDRVGDPQNVGAVLRSAAAFAAVAVVVAEHGAPPPTGALAKAASGALELVPMVRAVNLSRTLDRLKEAGYWCCGLDEGAKESLAALDLGPRVALVLGSEGGGLRRLIREECDYLARLPTRPDLPSLNVSNAAAVALYEMVRGQFSA